MSSTPLESPRSRRATALASALDPLALLLFGPMIVEVLLNADGAVWIDRMGSGLECLTSITNSLRIASRTNATAVPTRNRTETARSRADHDLRDSHVDRVHREHQLPRRRSPPSLHATLKRPQLRIRKLSWVFRLKAREQLRARAIRFFLEPAEHAWPDGFKRVLVCSPVAQCLR